MSTNQGKAALSGAYHLFERWERQAHLWTLIMVTAMSVNGCNTQRRSSGSSYIYSERLEDKWTDYVITSSEGLRKIETWITAHRAELEKGSKFANLARAPRRTLQWRGADGAVVNYELLRRYPIDSRPKAEAIYVENLSESALEDLREIAVSTGVSSERPMPVPAVEESCGEDSPDEDADQGDRKEEAGGGGTESP